MNKHLTLSRRDLLKASGGFLAVSFLMPSAVFAQQAATEKELPGDLGDHPMLSSLDPRQR